MRTPQPAPQWLIDKCGRVDTRRQTPRHQVTAEVDQAAARKRGVHYVCEEAPDALLGGRNDTAYKVAAYLRDLGLDQDNTQDLMDYWSADKCEPPMDPEEVDHVVNSVFRYGRNAPGSASPEAHFDPIDEPAAESPGGDNMPNLDPKPKKSGFKFISAAEIMEKLGPTDWQVKDFLETDSLGVIFGDQQSYKSFLALDVALCTAAGIPWHSHRTKQGPAVYIAGEGHNGMSKRIAAWGAHHKIDISNLPFRLSEHSATMLDSKSAKEVALAIAEISEELGPPAIIVVDTLSQNMGGDENSTADGSAFMKALNELLRAKFKATVIVIHHVGRKEKERSRGSYTIENNADFVYMLKRDSGKPTVELTNKKMKDAPPPPPIAFIAQSVVVAEMVDDSGDKQLIDSLVLETDDNRPSRKEPTSTARKAMEIISAFAESKGLPWHGNEVEIEAKQLRDFYAKDAKSAGAAQTAKKKYSRHITRLEDEGYLVRQGDMLTVLMFPNTEN